MGGASAPQLGSNNAFLGMMLNDSGGLGSASINNKGAQPPMNMVMADYGCELVAGPRSSLTPTGPIVDRSNQKTNSDPTKDDHEQQMNSIINAMAASTKGGHAPRHQTALDLRYQRESQKRVTENKVMKHMCDIQHAQHQNQMRSQDQQEDQVRMHTRGANLDREAAEQRKHHHRLGSMEERRRSVQTGRAATDSRQNVHRQSFVLPHPGDQAEGEAGLKRQGSFSMMANSQGGQQPAPALNVESILVQNPVSGPRLIQPEQQPSNTVVDINHLQSGSGAAQNQDGGRNVPSSIEPGPALQNN